jgi:benzoylformate decarboxylase
MQNFMPMRGQDSFYTMASGGLGYGLPASVGIALGRPNIRTVCLVGDGSAMYSIQALWTAAQRRLPLTVVVINNAGYGAMRSFSQVMQVRDVPGLDLPGIDFVQIAQGLGCDAVRVTKSSDLAPAFSTRRNVEAGPHPRRHCEERKRRSNPICRAMDCFAEPVIGRAFARPVGSQ